jgi:hypothetical protein
MGKSKVTVTNNLKPILKQYRQDVADAFLELAEEGQQRVQSQLDTGEAGLESDSGASRASVYTVANGVYFSGSRVKNAYGYNDAATQFLALMPGSTDADRGEELLLEPYITTSSRNYVTTAFASCSKVLAFWEEGHNNIFTGEYEFAPQFFSAQIYMKPRVLKKFARLLSKQSSRRGKGASSAKRK